MPHIQNSGILTLRQGRSNPVQTMEDLAFRLSAAGVGAHCAPLAHRMLRCSDDHTCVELAERRQILVSLLRLGSGPSLAKDTFHE
jgi:hypothetical protein